MPDLLNLAEALLRGRGGSRIAVREPQRAWTYGELGDTVARFAAALADLGVKRGDRVAVLMPQAPETAIAHVGAFKAGMVTLPLFTLFGLSLIHI